MGGKIRVLEDQSLGGLQKTKVSITSDHNLAGNPLRVQDYLSIGCTRSTWAVRPSEEIREALLGIQQD